MKGLKLSNIRRFIAAAFAALCASVITVAAVLTSGCFLFGETDSQKWVLKTVRENYYYYDDMDKDGLDALPISEIVKRLDIYSEYYTPSQLQALIRDNSGEKAGVGFSYSFIAAGASSLYPEGGCLIVSVVGNSPAEKSGMKAGALIVSGTYKGEVTLFDKEGALENFIDPIAENSGFTLTSSKGENYSVSKQNYTARYMFMATADAAYTAKFDVDGEVDGAEKTAGGGIDYLPAGFAYVSMSQFYGNAADEFGALMAEFNAENCTSLILDLRSNGGGYVDVMSDMAGYFTSSKGGDRYVSMTAQYKSGRKELYYCERHASDEGLVPENVNLYVLANSGTASASEALIGVLISYDFLKYENIFLSAYGGEFVDWAGGDMPSAKSYGKGIMQTTFTNRITGEALKLTTAQIYWPNNKCIHGVGLTESDGCRTVDTDWVVTPDDAELKKIISMITEDNP